MNSLNKINRKRGCPVLMMGLSLTMFPVLVSGDWTDWWRTPDQQALKLYESGRQNELVERAPNENWRALGQFQGEDFSAASSSFASSRETLLTEGQSDAATTALYNQGVSDVLSGEYEQAIEHFDNVLAEDSGYADAQHNRDIAEKLLELQKKSEDPQEQDGEEGEEGEESEDGEEGENSESSDSEQSSDSESSSEDPSDSENNSESENEPEQSNSSSGNEGDEDESSESASDQQQQEEEQQARDALAAEAEQELQENSEDAGEIMEQLVESEEPLTESEQATEQILRRIPDDPRGSLYVYASFCVCARWHSTEQAQRKHYHS